MNLKDLEQKAKAAFSCSFSSKDNNFIGYINVARPKAILALIERLREAELIILDTPGDVAEAYLAKHSDDISNCNSKNEKEK